MKDYNVAILSPSKETYSETFIHAHKTKLKGKIFYYYGLKKNKKLEGAGNLKNFWQKIKSRIQRKLFGKDYSWYFEQFLKTSFRKNKINVVFAEYGTTAQANISLIKELNLPLVVHFHGFDASNREVIKEHGYYKEVFDVAKFVVVVSVKMYNKLLEIGCPAHKLVYNVYGPDDIFFQVKPQFSRQQFIAVGRFVEKKAPYYVILAFKKVLEKFPKAKLIMAGNGALLAVCKNLSKYYDLEQNIVFPGVITPQQYMVYLETSIAMVQHSITAESGDSEGTPLSILEASAAGLPVISTKHAGIPDVIIDQKTGLLTEEHDVDGMAENMIKVIKDPEMASNLGENGKQNIKKNYTLQRHIKVLDDLLRKAVKDSRLI